MAARKPRYRDVTVVVTLRVHRSFTVAQAKQEMKTRVNDLSGHFTHVGTPSMPYDQYRQALQSDVRVRRITKWTRA